MKLPHWLLLFWIAPAAAAPLAFLHASLVDVEGGTTRPQFTVLVEDGRILAVGPDRSIVLPPDTVRIDAQGLWMIPGLWDMHVHLLRAGRPETHFPALIAHGVTGVRDMGGNFSFDEIRALRADIAAGRRTGPQIVAAGPILDGPQAQLPSISVALSGPDAARLEVARLRREGADFIKVFNGLPRDSYYAIAAAAEQQGLPFAGHVPMSVTAREASAAGQRSIEHLFNVLFACSSREQELIAMKLRARAPGEAGQRRQLRREYLRGVLDSTDATRARELFDLFASNGTWQVPTLVKRRAYALPDPSMARDPRLRYIPRSQRAWWDPRQDRQLQSRSAEDSVIERRYYDQDRALIAPMLRAGVPFLAGSDSGDPYTFPGFSLHDELELLVRNGMTPLLALQAATLGPARFLGRGDIGGIAAGMRADLVLLGADPLADIRNTRALRGVMAGGRYYDEAGLKGLLEQAERAAERY
ncbi:hypothetical protein D0B54_15335 [Solimonas sp. K1W22B-7]|uniref:amidohydrolase family protein n=1 Tax=Solimonas sp. K1W22B-7 TaxID=2303331 RepID=UPI000E3361DB|nr:amidohydrolase family protein [Solimonas sp. K1W22B-7]AXQ29966.1 hypothetical protein D0B54_15335 [Solimonas sp. K1W22B-7]